MNIPDNAAHINTIKWDERPLTFRCLKCYHQIPIERAKKDDKGYARCPGCDGYMRQMTADGDLYDTYV